ncbi:unnamed protein product [Didymodactylos carnosus]|uniref:B box-type domain-containing protein n=1 Tax=Didymodactylos carnosus TaxID=1234261 RepID=A0A815QMB4_9BILA|nr:unnamed protein product [Didymodactylos carnosus]CAF4334669.1 unnamed protein product [Didymodactylos carnosus]
MLGTDTGKARHIKIEILNGGEYEALLNSGRLSLLGASYNVDEFLAAPKILLCGRCNQGGHIKKFCQQSKFDICRRCGGVRTHLQDHRDCQIKCHHCGGDHESTSYKCQYISDFRYQLIQKLREHPEKLPPQVQLFIPTEFREKNDRQKTIVNKNARNERPLRQQQQQFNKTDSDSRAWPGWNSTTTGPSSSISQADELIKSFTQRLDEMEKRHETENRLAQERYEAEKMRIEIKYKLHIESLSKAWLLTDQTQEMQQRIISKTTTATREAFTSIIEMAEALAGTVNELKKQSGTEVFDGWLHLIQTHRNQLKGTHVRYNEQLKEMESFQSEYNASKKNALLTLFSSNNV